MRLWRGTRKRVNNPNLKDRASFAKRNCELGVTPNKTFAVNPYKDSTIYLDRKYNVYRKFCEKFGD